MQNIFERAGLPIFDILATMRGNGFALAARHLQTPRASRRPCPPAIFHPPRPPRPSRPPAAFCHHTFVLVKGSDLPFLLIEGKQFMLIYTDADVGAVGWLIIY